MEGGGGEGRVDGVREGGGEEGGRGEGRREGECVRLNLPPFLYCKGVALIR